MKFFLVDDDPDILALLKRVLEGEGNQAETCLSSTDGFELTRELRSRPERARMKIDGWAPTSSATRLRKAAPSCSSPARPVSSPGGRRGPAGRRA